MPKHIHHRAVVAAMAAAFFLALGVNIPAMASDRRELCPAEIHTRQALPGPIPEWVAVNLPTRNVLTTIEVFEGVPSKRVALEYNSDKPLPGGRDLFSWHLDVHKQYWVQCEYFDTSVGLQKALRVGTKRCELIARRGPVAESAVCD